MSRRTREKDRGCRTEETCLGEGRKGVGAGRGERGRTTDGKVEWQREPSGTGLRPLILQLHMQPPCAYIPLGQVVLSGLRASERASAPQLIKPPRNLYRHYTRCFACKNHLRRTPDCPARPRQRTTTAEDRGRFLRGSRPLSIQQLGLNGYVIYTRDAQTRNLYRYC